MTELRLAVIGFGGMGAGLAKRAATLERVRVTGAVDSREASRERAREEFELETFETVEELLEAEAADAVYIATPNKFHAPLSVQCLQAGLHVFCEKPMAMDAQEGRRMIEAAEEADRKLTINLSFRQDRAARALKDLADAGELGQVYFARTGWLRNRGIPLGSGWFGDRGLAGGGPLIDLGVHRIDMALWLMGHPEPVAVSGATYDMLGKRIAAERGQEFDVEDLAAGFVRFEGGATLAIAVSWATNSEWAEEMYTCVYGTKAGAVHRHVGGTYEFEARLWRPVGSAFGETRLSKLPPPSSHLEDFAEAVLEDGPVPVDPWDALRVQRIIDALYASAESGEEVRLDQS
jgi:predicted dehydrogenase